MNALTRGFRNAFRNTTRSISIVIILGLAIGLSLVMLIAHQAVANKINTINSSIGNTVTITPAGYSNFSSVNNALTTSELSKVSSLNHVTNLSESLTGRLTTIGSASLQFGGSNSTSNTNQTSLTSPVKINTSKFGHGGPGVFFNGGGGFSLPSNFSPPISIVGTTDPTNINGQSLSISSGQAINGTTNDNSAMISNQMASKNNLKVGSTFTAYSTTMTVKGIFNVSSTNGLGNNVIVSLPTEQRLSGQGSNVTEAIATVDSLVNLNTATNEIKNALGSSADVISSTEQAQATISPLNNIETISLYSLIGAIFAGTIIIFLIMIMIVRERRREIGILKAIGASNLKVIFQFMSEAITLTLAGALIGIIIGVAAANPITHLLVTNSTSSQSGSLNRGPGGFRGLASNRAGNFTLREANRGAFRGISNSIGNIQTVVGWTVILDGLGAAIIIAIIGSTASSFVIAKVRPAEVMRVE